MRVLIVEDDLNLNRSLVAEFQAKGFNVLSATDGREGQYLATEYRRRAERQITGYWVDYRHRGRLYRILSHERPGRHIRIAVRS